MHFAVFMIVTAFLAIALKVFPAMNRVPEDPEATFVPIGILGIYAVMAGFIAVVIGVVARVKMRRDPSRWSNHSEATAAVSLGLICVAVASTTIV